MSGRRRSTHAVQDRLRPLVDLVGPGPTAPRTVAGLDVAYAEDSDHLAAAVVVLHARTLAGNRYDGVNVTMRTPSGHLMEVQFDTDTSRAARAHSQRFSGREQIGARA